MKINFISSRYHLRSEGCMWGTKVKQYYTVVFKSLIKNNKLNIKTVSVNCVSAESINNLVLSEYLIYLKNVVYP